MLLIILKKKIPSCSFRNILSRVDVRVSSIGEIDLLANYLYLIGILDII